MGELSVHCTLCVTSKQSFSSLCGIPDLHHGELSRPFCQKAVKPQSLLLSIHLDPGCSKAHTGHQLLALCQEPAGAQLFRSNCCSGISMNLNFWIKALQKLSRKSILKSILESQCSFPFFSFGQELFLVVYAFLSSSVVSDKRSRLTYVLNIFLERMQGDCYPESLRSISLPFRLHGHTFCLGPGDHSPRLLQ